jgi:hypothetical protein
MLSTAVTGPTVKRPLSVETGISPVDGGVGEGERDELPLLPST